MFNPNLPKFGEDRSKEKLLDAVAALPHPPGIDIWERGKYIPGPTSI